MAGASSATKDAQAMDFITSDARTMRRMITAWVPRCSLGTLLILAAIAPLAVSGSFGLARLETLVLYVTVGLALNLLFGYVGDIALGFIVNMGVAAYAAGMFSALVHFGFIPSVCLGIIAGTIFGTVTLLPGLRVHGFYLGLVTLFLIFVLPDAVLIGQNWTGGENGLIGIGSVQVGSAILPAWAVYEIMVALALVAWILCRNIISSGWGLRLKTTRDAPRAGDAVGISLGRTRVVIYVVASVMISAAGTLLAYSQQFVSTQGFGIDSTMLLLTGVVLGGKGTISGPLLGVIPMAGITLYVGEFSSWNPIIFGIILVLIVILLPDGVMPWIIRGLRGRPSPAGDGDSDRSAGSPPRGADTRSHSLGMVRSYESGERPELTSNDVSRHADRAVTRPILRVSDVKVNFGGVRALDDVSIDLTAGEILGLVGANGSGKSTLLNVISGFVTPQSGHISHGSDDITTWSPARVARLGVGRTFQVPQLLGDATVAENIELGMLRAYRSDFWGALFRTPGFIRRQQERCERVRSVVRSLEIPQELVDSPASSLPLGLKRVVEIARAVSSGPSLLLLDEPAAGLNESEREILSSALRRLRETDIAIVLVGHNVKYVLETCDSLILMDSGRVVARTEVGVGVDRFPDPIRTYLQYGLVSEVSNG